MWQNIMTSSATLSRFEGILRGDKSYSPLLPWNRSDGRTQSFFLPFIDGGAKSIHHLPGLWSIIRQQNSTRKVSPAQERAHSPKLQMDAPEKKRHVLPIHRSTCSFLTGFSEL
jgi:hypothetical protein